MAGFFIPLNIVMQNWGVKISGYGANLPGKAISNDQLKEMYHLDFDPEKHAATTGIKYRHFGDASVTTSMIAAEAAKQALQSANVEAKDLGRIILGTQTADYMNTAASCQVQYLLGASCPVGDTTASCSSFMYALDTALRLVATGCDKVMLIGADMKSRSVRKTDKIFLPIFSDGAGALLLEKTEDVGGFLGIKLWADGSGYKDIIVPAGGSAMPASIDTVNNDLHGTFINKDGKKMAIFMASIMASIAKQLCNELNIDMDDIDLFVPHQANYFIMKRTANLLKIPLHKMEVSIDRVGNCISGTIPITLHQAYKNGRMKKGSLVLITAAGAGYTGGAALYKCI